ncbi:MAG: PQQ-binding-like beta-propeller repeat protein [Planctomycetaceae bacterium]
MPAHLLIAFSLLASVVCAGDWPMFRGPANQGVAAGEGYALNWGPDKHVRWRVELAGPGNGSPIVIGDRVLLVGATQQGRQRSLHCFNRSDGSERWSRSVEFMGTEPTHTTNPYGATTPATDGERVVVWHGSAGLFCYSVDGDLLWSADTGSFQHIWGYATSPVIHDGKVIQQCGPGSRQFVAAFDLQTGEKLWQTDEPNGSNSDQGRYVGSWATPQIVDVAGQTQILCGLPTRVVALDPADGRVIWFVRGVSSDRADLMYTTPLVQDQFAVAFGGFGGPAMGFTLGGSGDVTETNRKWLDPPQPRQPQRIGSGAIVGDFVYIANADDPGSIDCRDLQTGQSRWRVRRTGDGPHWGSIIHAEGRLYAPGQSGVTTVFAPNPEKYEELAINDLGEQTHATPAFSDGEVFIRTWKALYCIRQP